MSIFFFNDTATTEIYPLSLHDALPICRRSTRARMTSSTPGGTSPAAPPAPASGSTSSRATSPTKNGLPPVRSRSEEHTSELQSRQYLVCRLLLEKKKNSSSHRPIQKHE